MFTLRLSQLLLFLLLASLLVAGCAPASPSLAIAEPTVLPVNPAAGSAEPRSLDVVTNTPAPLPTAIAASSATPAPLISVTPVPETPEAVVRAFYKWYLAYIGDPATGTFRNPLVDRAYHDAPYLNQSFVQHIDELLDEMHRQGGGGYDPILCAQDIPKFVEPELAFAHNGMASVVWHSSFPNQMVSVDLQPQDDSWLISDITCPFDAPGIAKVFYTWYLGTIGDRSGGEFHNPLVERAYLGHPLLADSFEQQVTETVAGFAGGGFDPFLLAQDIPQDFSVDPGPEEGTAVVHLQFGPHNVRHLRVTMDETGRRIASISEDMPSTSPASVYTSSDYGFTFSYTHVIFAHPYRPETWVVFTDWVTTFPGREVQALEAGPMWQLLLDSLQFEH